MATSHMDIPATAREMYRTGETITPESLLLDSAERIGRNRYGRLAVQLHLSRLRAQNRQESHLRIALRMFDPLVSGYRCQVFLLTNGDIFIVGGEVPFSELDNAVYRLRALFNKDPLIYLTPEGGEDPFVTFYDLERDYDTFLDEVNRLRDEVEARKKEGGSARPAELLNMDPEMLEGVMDSLKQVNMADLLRRQSAITVVSSNQAKVTFQEFYISMTDLRLATAPNVNILANRWLFQYLTEEVDRRSLVALQHMRLAEKPKVFSLNLNLSSLHSREFEAFCKSLDADQSINVELQLIDVFADLNAFFRVRDELRAKGYKIILDGLTSATLHFTDPSKLEVDAIKIQWSPDLAEAKYKDTERDPKDIILAMGSNKVILGRCDSELSIRWGLTMGILSYQGRLIDMMLTLATMSGCKDSKNCTATQCTMRRFGVSPAERKGCTNFVSLDSFPPINPENLAKRVKKKKGA